MVLLFFLCVELFLVRQVLLLLSQQELFRMHIFFERMCFWQTRSWWVVNLPALLFPKQPYVMVLLFSLCVELFFHWKFEQNNTVLFSQQELFRIRIFSERNPPPLHSKDSLMVVLLFFLCVQLFLVNLFYFFIFKVVLLQQELFRLYIFFERVSFWQARSWWGMHWATVYKQLIHSNMSTLKQRKCVHMK